VQRIVLILILLVLTPSLAQQIVDDNPDLTLVWEHVQQQPADFAAGCMPIEDPSQAVLYNEDRLFPLASVTKLLVFIEYARRLDAGDISFGEMVSLNALNRYDLPGTNRGAHDEFIGLYREGTTAISLWEVASTGMMQFSSNAASDFMLERLDPVDWNELYRTLGIGSTSYPHPLTRIPLLMNNHETGQPSMADVQSLSIEEAQSYFERYVNDPVWRAAEIEYRSNRRRDFPGWNIQAAILQQHTATGTVTDMLNILQAIYINNDALTPSARDIIREALKWRGYQSIDNAYIEYGSKLGFYSGGVLALVAYGDPYVSDPVISVSLFRNIPRQTYNEMLFEDSIGGLAHWMHLNACAGLMEAIEGASDGNTPTR
jgi:D-alanyl-D-alanine carboxypeptidase